MSRTDNDSWDITQSVGSTALGVAAARAAETRSEDPLIEDPFAAMFVEAAGYGLWTLYANPTSDLDPVLRARMQVMIDFVAVRTAFFDEFFLDAAQAGVRQVVILAAGLDARAWRLAWPDGVTVYELDQPKVLEFKSAALQQHGARPGPNQVNVPVDLRQDWPKSLQHAGFDASEPTAWSAEGLLRYLPASSQDQLVALVHALSPAGSWFATNAPRGGHLDHRRLTSHREHMRRMRSAAAELVNAEIPDVADLWYAGERTDVGNWLAEHGWDASVTTMSQMLTRYGRNNHDQDSLPRTVFVSAQRLTT